MTGIIAKISAIEDATADLDTAVKALHVLADNMEDKGGDDAMHLVRFMANSFGAIHRRVQDGINTAIRADHLKAVE